jgi:hypothetical protein
MVYLVGTVTSHSELNILFTGCNISFPLPGNLRIFFMGIYVIIKVIKVVKFLNFLVISMFDLTVCYCFFYSFGFRSEDLHRDHRGIRLEAIHFRGLTNMNTKDVFSYFQEFGPRGVEWIDDMSCN